MKTKKFFSVFLTCAMLIALLPTLAMPAKAIDIGSWSDNYSANAPSYDEATKTYTISSAAELAWVAHQCNDSSINNTFNGKTIVLSTDIDLSAHLWAAIGTEFYNFQGTFDGNGKTITGLQISGTDSNYYIGLFGYVYQATIKNVTLSGVNISAAVNDEEYDHYAGALAGWAHYSTITGCSASGNMTVSNTVTGADPHTFYAGGLLGYTCGKPVSGCSSSVAITGSCGTTASSRCIIGGLIGEADSTTTLSGSYATGTISTSVNTRGVIFTGGLIGEIEGTNTKLSNSYATGSISGSFAYGGGLVGKISINDSSIKNCYAIVNVTDTDSNDTFAGGFIGSTSSNDISNSYSAGTVDGAKCNGGFAGSYTSVSPVSSAWYLYPYSSNMNSNGNGDADSGASDNTPASMPTASFAATLNNSQSPAPWTWISGINNNYPVLNGVGDGNVPTYSVSGTVSAGSTGVTALNGIEVKLYKYDSNTYTYSATTYKANTADDGSFIIASVPNGTYKAVIAAGDNYGESAAADITVSGADVTACTDIALAPKPDYTVTYSAGKYLVNGGGTATTLNAALSGCGAVSGKLVQLGSAVAPLSVSAIKTDTVTTANDLVSATYTGSVRYIRDIVDSATIAYGMRVPSGADVKFNCLKIDGDNSTDGTNSAVYVGGALAVNDGTVITSSGTYDFGIYNDSGSVTVNGGTIGNGKNVGIENAGTGTLKISDGTITGGGNIGAVEQSSSNTLTVTGGTIAFTDSARTQSSGISILGLGKVTVTGGTVSAAGGENAAIKMVSGPNTVVTLDVGDGTGGPTISGTDGAFAIGYGSSDVTGRGVINIKSGILTAEKDCALEITPGGTVNLTGGTVSVTGSTQMIAAIVNCGSTVNISGGTVSAADSGTGNAYAVCCAGGRRGDGTFPGAVNISGSTKLNSTSADVIYLPGTNYKADVSIFGKTVNSSPYANIYCGGSPSGSKYEINPDNYASSYVSGSLTTAALHYGYTFGYWYWAKDADTEVFLSKYNPGTISSMTTGANAAAANINLGVLTTQDINLFPGSLGRVDEGELKIVGLTSGTKYKVTEGTNVYFVKADGTLSDKESDAAGLTGTEIPNLTAGKLYNVEVCTPGSENPGGSYAPPAKDSASVTIGGITQNAGTAETSTAGGKTTTTVTLSTDKLEKILDGSSSGATVTLPITTGSDTVSGKLDGQAVKELEAKDATLVITTGTASYTLPASEIAIDSVSEKFGKSVSLTDISVSVSISEPSDSMVKVVKDTASAGGYAIQAPPVEFAVCCTYGGQTVEVNKFNAYVERQIAIPAGVDPSKITTAIVVDAAGSVRHVPTEITVVDGKYYAKINSLTNSVYTLIYHPTKFSDVENHWAKNAINDMGSRLVVSGVGNNNYEPDRSITRAEFAAIMVSALGLKPGTGTNGFKDVASTDWFCGYVETAASYGIISGYDASTFGPNDTITREQAMAMAAKAMKITGLKVSLTDSAASTLLAAYTDASSASSYAKASIAACLKAGIVSGTGKDKLSPKDYVTRAEVAVIAEQLLKQSGLI